MAEFDYQGDQAYQVRSLSKLHSYLLTNNIILGSDTSCALLENGGLKCTCLVSK